MRLTDEDIGSEFEYHPIPLEGEKPRVLRVILVRYSKATAWVRRVDTGAGLEVFIAALKPSTRTTK